MRGCAPPRPCRRNDGRGGVGTQGCTQEVDALLDDRDHDGLAGGHAVEDERHGAGEELVLALPQEGLVAVSVVGPDWSAGRVVLARAGAPQRRGRGGSGRHLVDPPSELGPSGAAFAGVWGGRATRHYTSPGTDKRSGMGRLARSPCAHAGGGPGPTAALPVPSSVLDDPEGRRRDLRPLVRGSTRRTGRWCCSAAPLRPLMTAVLRRRQRRRVLRVAVPVVLPHRPWSRTDRNCAWMVVRVCTPGPVWDLRAHARAERVRQQLPVQR